MIKSCKQCQTEFEVTEDDLNFYKKISPTFDGKTFEIPAPQLCPDCRIGNKLCFRNESKFYKIKSALSGQELISQCSPECKFTIYSNEEWNSDCWDPMDYGRDYDPTKSFLEQLLELNHSVPMPHASLTPDNENSEFIGNASGSKNCYLISNSTNPERCLYGVGFWYSKDCVDCYKVYTCENCYEVVVGYNCYSCFYSQNIKNCSESYFLDSCVGCRNCFACANLNNKQYWAFNQPSTKEEIAKLITDWEADNNSTITDRAIKFLRNQPKRYAQIFASEDSTGNYLNNCKNVHHSFFVTEAENVKYSTNLSDNTKDSYDCCFVGMNMSNNYNGVTLGIDTSNIISCSHVYSNVNNIFYSIYCINGCSDIFGCVGLKHKQYCILNKQYTKEEYNKLCSRIIDKMIEDGEWGEFLPNSFSHFGYNDSLASYFFPLSKNEAINIGSNWTEKDYNLKFEGIFYQPLKISDYDPKNSDNNIDKALSGVIKCEVSGRPFKIVHAELAFYIKNRIPIPHIHPESRQARRFKVCNTFTLYKRSCMNEGCQNELDTTYSPDREEKVYCEQCYKKEIL